MDKVLVIKKAKGVVRLNIGTNSLDFKKGKTEIDKALVDVYKDKFKAAVDLGWLEIKPVEDDKTEDNKTEDNKNNKTEIKKRQNGNKKANK